MSVKAIWISRLGGLTSSILSKILIMLAICVLVTAATSQYVVWRTSVDHATNSTSTLGEQIGKILAGDVAGDIQTGNTSALQRRFDDAVRNAGGVVSNAVLWDATGAAVVQTGDATASLHAAAKRSLASGEIRQSADSLEMSFPVLAQNSGTIVGAVSLRLDPEPMLERAGQASIKAGIIILLVLVSSLLPMLWLLRTGLMEPMRDLGEAMARISKGEYGFSIRGRHRVGEFGTISQDLETFRSVVEQNAVTAQRNLFRSAAYSETNSAMMMIDRKRRIIDMNKAGEALIAANEEEFSAYWKTFEVGPLTGTNIDKFHKNPDRVKEILSDPTKMPYVADIAIGNMKLEMRISAIYDENGDHAGNILEWQDVGEARLSSGIIDVLSDNQNVIEYLPDGSVFRANEKACHCFGLASGEFRSLSFVDTFAEGDLVAGETFKGLFEGNGFSGKTRRRHVRGEDEFWLQASINLVRDGNGMPYRIVEISSDITEQESEIRRVDADRVKILKNQEVVVDALKAGLGDLAKGQLSGTIGDNFPAEYEQLARNFNTATLQLRQTLSKMIHVSENFQEGTQEISQASDDLSRRTESQAATLANTASALDELTNSVKSSAKGARSADKSVRGAKENAQSGGDIVVQAVAAMREIESSSSHIGQIIAVIDDIAFQTNLLALNAGVEAARAGDAGRGFAVVASEVRALAQRSSDAAKEIKDLISTSHAHVENGVALVDETGEALRNIVTSVENIAIQVAEMATSSQEQAEGLEEINGGMNRLDAVTQQNAAMVEQATAASHAMRTEARTMTDLISFFSTGDDEFAVPAAQTSSAVHTEKSERRKADRRMPDNEPILLKKQVGQAVQQEAQAWEDAHKGWEDF